MNWCKLTSLVALAILMMGCAGQTRHDQAPQNWQEHSSVLTALVNWTMKGKIAFRNADHAESATLYWMQDNELTEVRLSGPLGFAATTISSDGEVMEVKQAEETRRYAVADTRAIYTDTGMELPLQSLPYWLKGIPNPNISIEYQKFMGGQLTQLVQSGWTIHYDQYKPFNSYLLPTKLNMNHSDTQVRLIMRQWMTENIK